jgi:hypothetical protein
MNTDYHFGNKGKTRLAADAASGTVKCVLEKIPSARRS